MAYYQKNTFYQKNTRDISRIFSKYFEVSSWMLNDIDYSESYSHKVIVNIIDQKSIDEKKIAEVFSREWGIPFLSLENYSLSQDIINDFPSFIMDDYTCIPLGKIDNKFMLLISIPFSQAEWDQILMKLDQEPFLIDQEPFLYIGLRSEIRQILNDYKIPEKAKQERTEKSEASQDIWRTIFDEADIAQQEELKQQEAKQQEAKQQETKQQETKQQETKQEVERVTEHGIRIIEEISSPKNEKEFFSDSAWNSMFEDIDKKVQEELRKKADLYEDIEEEPAETNYEIYESIFDKADREIQEELRKKEVPKPVESYATLFETTNDEIQEELKMKLRTEYEKSNLSPELEDHLQKNPMDFDAVNQYIEKCLSAGDIPAMVKQLLRTGFALEEKGDIDGAVNCYDYILEQAPNNFIALEKIRNLCEGQM